MNISKTNKNILFTIFCIFSFVFVTIFSFYIIIYSGINNACYGAGNIFIYSLCKFWQYYTVVFVLFFPNSVLF